MIAWSFFGFCFCFFFGFCYMQGNQFVFQMQKDETQGCALLLQVTWLDITVQRPYWVKIRCSLLTLWCPSALIHNHEWAASGIDWDPWFPWKQFQNESMALHTGEPSEGGKWVYMAAESVWKALFLSYWIRLRLTLFGRPHLCLSGTPFFS